MNKFIPLCVPNFEGNEEKYVNDAVHQGWVSTGGQYIVDLEEKLSKFLNVEKVAAVQSGTAALHLALIDCGVTATDVVFVPTLTFIAAVNPVKYLGAEPIFIGCDDSLCMDPNLLEKYCKEECNFVNNMLIDKRTKKRIKALIVVHVFGNLADMERIMKIANKYNFKVIEDSTEALGTKYKTGIYEGKYAGTIGDYGAFSFNGNKIITTGGGGAITSRLSKNVDHMKYLSTQAKDDPHYYIHNEIGYNYRMTNLQAALGVAQLEELPDFINRKNKNYLIYSAKFDNFELGSLMGFRKNISSNKWFYSLKIDMAKINGNMRDIITALEKKGIGTRPIWGLIHEQIPYKNCIAYHVEKDAMYSKCILNIPSSTSITKEEIDYVVQKIKDVLNELKR